MLVEADEQMNSVTALEEDLELLKTDLSLSLRMAVVYRSERKKIIKSQLHLVNLVSQFLQKIESSSDIDMKSNVFTKLIIMETIQEIKWSL